MSPTTTIDCPPSSVSSASPLLSDMMRPLVDECKVLVVGAGGIGCELLKNLVLSGFRDIEVVDLDTIELSNLNRQFLFRRHHIGQSKAKVAAEAVTQMSLDGQIKIIPHFANIQDTNYFSISFFQKFTLILNALDNLEARRYVNNMCLATGIPLIESGTAGYLGQTSVILPGITECFDCNPKELPQTFPVCTIRTNPTAPIHCIVWAKDFLLPQLFGPISTEDNTGSQDDEKLLEILRKETQEFNRMRTALGAGEFEEYSKMVFEKIFNQDIQQALQMEELWESRGKPHPLQTPEKWPEFDYRTADEHVSWTLDQWTAIFHRSVMTLAYRFHENGREIVFDKDDDDTMDFVAATANIRAHIYSIPMNSRFTLKSMAGNIIPAIATTNAIIAGQIVLQALNLLRYQGNVKGNSKDATRDDGNTKEDNHQKQQVYEGRLVNAFVTYGTRRGTLFACEQLSLPSPVCAICAIDRAIIHVNLQEMLFSQFIELVVEAYGSKKGQSLTDWKEDLTVLEGSRMLYDLDMDGGNLSKTLAQLSIQDSTFIKFDFISLDDALLVAVVNTTRPSTIDFTCIISEERRAQKKALLEERDRLVEEQANQEIAEPPTKMARGENLASLVVVDDDDLEIL